ncbi:MAG TPA: hypothetical protein VFH56_05725 [Acidimicrobiales bacterium]|nr:hypothetical protein [Acidimicrobiales bacterium]
MSRRYDEFDRRAGRSMAREDVERVRAKVQAHPLTYPSLSAAVRGSRDSWATLIAAKVADGATPSGHALYCFRLLDRYAGYLAAVNRAR